MLKPDHAISRRGFLAAAGAVGAAACAPAAVPPPGAAPPAAPGSAKAPWEQEWDRLIAAAKQEGKVSVFTLTGTGYRKALDAFESAFGITVEHQAEASASIWVPKMQKEREAGVYSFDVVVVPPNSALLRLKPQGAWDPIRPALFRPDVTDDKAWRDGFDGQFMDVDKQLAFSYEYDVNHAISIDTNQVQPDEIKTVKDLLNPKWKGRMMFSDVRVGSTYLAMTAIRDQFPDGDAMVRTLLVDQQPVFVRDARQRAEAVVRGTFPVVLGAAPAALKEFRDAGVAGHVKYLDIPEIDIIFNYSVFLYNKAPHPNARKLFANWLLTKEGQTVWCKNVPTNSARVDVEVFNHDGAPSPGRKYYASGQESTYAKQADTQKHINGLVGITN